VAAPPPNDALNIVASLLCAVSTTTIGSEAARTGAKLQVGAGEAFMGQNKWKSSRRWVARRRRPPMLELMTVGHESIHALHRYFIWANRMRDHLVDLFEDEINPFYARLSAEELESLTGQDVSDQLWSIPLFMYLSYWLAALYIVTEGWQALKLSDERVDARLTDEALTRLRQFRNAVLHYQPEYVDKRVQSVFNDLEGVSRWAHELHDAYSAFFLEYYQHRSAGGA
jgi:hypothetical protein